jgi:hypothetical protein
LDFLGTLLTYRDELVLLPQLLVFVPKGLHLALEAIVALLLKSKVFLRDVPKIGYSQLMRIGTILNLLEQLFVLKFDPAQSAR